VDERPADEGPNPQAIVALTTEIQAVGRRRSRLAAELESQERQASALQAELLQLLGADGSGPGRHGSPHLLEPRPRLLGTRRG
jgi:hypothetical protein